MLGQVGQGFQQAMHVLEGGRIAMAALSLGIAKGAFEVAIKHAQTRCQFKQPIAHFQGVAFMPTKAYNQPHLSSLRFVLSTLQPFRLYLGAIILILLFYSGNVFWKTHLIKDLIDTATQAASPVHQLWPIAGYLGLALCIELLTFRLQEWCTLRYEPALQNYATALIFQHVLQREYSCFQKHLAGNLVAKVNDVATCILSIVAICLYDYLVNFLLVIVAFLTLWKIAIGCALSISLWFLLNLCTVAFLNKRVRNLASHAAETEAQIAGHITDVFNNLLSTRLFSAQAHTLRRLNKFQTSYLNTSQQYRWLMLKFYSFQGVNFQLYQGLCMVLLIHLYSQHRVTAGDFAMVFSTNIIITESLWKMFERMQKLNALWGKVSQAVQVLLAPPRIQDKPHASPLVVNTGTISFEEVTFSYSKASPLLNKQTIYIKAKQKVGLVGYSGSGKTTFINLIARLFDVDSGAILIDGQDLRHVTQETLHQAITMVPQESHLFHSTILEKIRYGRPNAADSELMAAAQKACAHEFIVKLPQQYETSVGERGLNLSGGQRQRIAIARALLKGAPIVLLDEVTAHLDGATEQKINISLAAWVRDKTALIISHHLDTLRAMDRILVFNKGKIVEDGTHQQLLAQGGHYTTLLNLQKAPLHQQVSTD